MDCVELMDYVSVLKDGLMRIVQEVSYFLFVYVHLSNAFGEDAVFDASAVTLFFAEAMCQVYLALFSIPNSVSLL